MTAMIAPTSMPFPGEQGQHQGVNVAPTSYLVQRTTRRRRVLPNIDCIQLDQPTTWDVSMPSELGGSSENASDAGRAGHHKANKTQKPTKFVNKTTNSWVSTNTTTTVVLPSAMVQLVSPLGPVRGSLPRRGESPYEDVRVNNAPQGYLVSGADGGNQGRPVPRMAPPSMGMAPPSQSRGGAAPHEFSYMDAYRPVGYRPSPVPYMPYASRGDGGSSRVEVLEDSVPSQRLSVAGKVATPNGVRPAPQRSSLPAVANSADRLSGSSAVPSVMRRPASYDGGDRRPVYHTTQRLPGQPSGQLSGSQPAPRQNNFMSPPSDRVVMASTSLRMPDEASYSARHTNSEGSHHPREVAAATTASTSDVGTGFSGPRFYAERDRKDAYAEGTPSGRKGVEELVFAHEL